MIRAGFVSGIQPRHQFTSAGDTPCSSPSFCTRAQGFLQGTGTAERTGVGRAGTVRNSTFGKSNTGLLSGPSSSLGHPALPRDCPSSCYKLQLAFSSSKFQSEPVHPRLLAFKLCPTLKTSILMSNFVFYSRKITFF